MPNPIPLLGQDRDGSPWTIHPSTCCGGLSRAEKERSIAKLMWGSSSLKLNKQDWSTGIDGRGLQPLCITESTDPLQPHAA